MKTDHSSSRFTPRILVFFCNKCQGPGAQSVAFAASSADAEIPTVHFCCAREVTPDHLAQAFRDGADGVLICGCLVRSCSTSDNDLEVLRDLYRNQLQVKSLGLGTDRLREEWIVGGTTENLSDIIADFSRQLRELGPAPGRKTPPDTPPAAMEERA